MGCNVIVDHARTLDVPSHVVLGGVGWGVMSSLALHARWMFRHTLFRRGGTYFTHAQTCDNVRVQSATQWTASVHTLHMPKPVITFVFKVDAAPCSLH